jgi:hypothetical protein
VRKQIHYLSESIEGLLYDVRCHLFVHFYFSHCFLSLLLFLRIGFLYSEVVIIGEIIHIF